MTLNKFIFSILLISVARTAVAENTYKKIDPQISKFITAQDFSSLDINFSGQAGIKSYSQYTPPISYVALPKLKLAGLQLNPATYASLSTSPVNKLALFDFASKKEKEIKLPKGRFIRSSAWSDGNSYVAVTAESNNCLELWVVNAKTLQKEKLPFCMNTVAGASYYWISDTELLISARTAAQKSPFVVEPQIPTGPIIQETKGQVSQNRTYQNLLKSPQDEINFEKVATNQIYIYHVKTKKKIAFGKPSIWKSVSVSPDKKYFLATKIVRPYSYSVPIDFFANEMAVYDISGNLKYSIAKGGPYENIPIGGVVKDPRSFRWITNEPHSLFYVKALDEGDWKVKVEYRDELFRIDLETNGKTKTTSLYKFKNRFSGISVFDKGLGYLVYDYERDTEWIKTIHLKFDKSNKLISEKVLLSHNENDEYKDLGNPVTVFNEFDRSVIGLDSDNESIYLSSSGATPQGYRPVLYKFNINSLKTEEVYRSPVGVTDRFKGFLQNKKFDVFITSYETATESPRYNINRIKNGKIETELLYADPNPFAELSNLKKEVLKYKRADGIPLSGTLYYPLNYEVGKKYPLIVDAYPLEYTDASTAGQVRNSASTYEVPFRASTLYMALRGYAVLMDAQIPIIGHPETKNDTFLKQLKEGAEAAVLAVAEKGVADPNRAGVIGHSYGAFMVANLLTHTDLFKTGVARSGAYNRSLTPYGFQGERRTYWQAKDTYLKVSPFHEADKMKKPILLIHGQNDNNSGTLTMQSERYFDALKGQGVTAKLVLLPEESHGYVALETIEHVLYETFEWFDKYVRDAAPTKK